MAVELLTFLVGVMLLAGCTYAGFLFGRDAAERHAGETIANLRRQVVAYRARQDRLESRNAQLAAALHYAQPPNTAVPEWMRDA